MKHEQHIDALIWAMGGASLEATDELAKMRTEVVAIAEGAHSENDEKIESVAQQAMAALDAALEGQGSLEAIRNTLTALIEVVVGEQQRKSSAPVEDAGDDLLSMFLGSCGDNLDNIEQILLGAETEPLDNEGINELRRLIHTFKGECGVLSLQTAQTVCHEAETMVDRIIEEGLELPMSTLFDLVDWCRQYVADLAVDSHSPAPDPGPIMAAILGGKGTEPAAAPEPEPEAKKSGEIPSRISDSAVDANDERVTFPEAIAADDTLPEFLSEALGHLEDAEEALLAMDEEDQAGENIDRIFRAFHTIKGVGGFLGLDAICSLAHSSESLLDRFRKKELTWHSGYGDLILQAKDMMAQLLGALAGDVAPRVSVLKNMVARLDAAFEGRIVPEISVGQALDTALNNSNADGQEESMDLEHAPEKAVARVGNLLVDAGLITPAARDRALEYQNKLQESGQSLRFGEVLVELGLLRKAQIEEVLNGAQGTAKTLLNTKVGPQPVPPPAPARSSTKPARGGAGVSLDSTIKVNTQRLDSLVDLVGELVIAQQMVFQDPFIAASGDEQLRRNLSQLSKITRDLQEASMSLRMVTFKSTFQKMHRLVRDVSGKAGKPCQLLLEGADTEVDRNVVDKISDPLVHLLRNAIDHGLENPAGRAAAGKPAQGTVVLSARHQSGSIVISIRDDGGGLNRERILAKAMEKGLVPSDGSAQDMPDSAVYKLIFHAGFSTAQAVTDISGRGVGMDVVRKNIESMRGRIDIQSVAGQGTTFLIQLPLTLAIIDAMVVRSNEERYVLPTLSIVQSFQPTPRQVQHLCTGMSLVNIRGQMVPLRGLEDVLHNRRQPVEPGESTLILVESSDQQVCLCVDEIIGQQQVVIKNLGKGVGSLPCISGGAILGDGRVALIVDTDELIAGTATTAAQ
ncbi:MAG: chemotaxis protein CheA [Planctomycetota bacterium]